MKPIITMNEQTALLTAVKETGFQFHKKRAESMPTISIHLSVSWTGIASASI